MGAVYWQLNDCWPVASWSSVDYCQRLKELHYFAKRFFAPVMISCEEEGMINSGQELVRLPFEFPKSIRLNVANESMQDQEVTVKWQVRDAAAHVLRMEEEKYKKLVLSRLRQRNPMNYEILVKTKYYRLPVAKVASEYGITANNVNNRNLRSKAWITEELEKICRQSYK